jgi:excisionase family DNA binding protein
LPKQGSHRSTERWLFCASGRFYSLLVQFYSVFTIEHGFYLDKNGSFSNGDCERIRLEKCQGGKRLKESVYKSYDELPLFLNADMVAKVLGIAPSTGYELMHEKDFPTLKIGNRILVPKEEFQQWIKNHITGGME